MSFRPHLAMPESLKRSCKTFLAECVDREISFSLSKVLKGARKLVDPIAFFVKHTFLEGISIASYMCQLENKKVLLVLS